MCVHHIPECFPCTHDWMISGNRIQKFEISHFCSRVLPDKETMLKEVLETAATIASKSPIAVQGTKLSLVYSRDHSVPDSLQQVVRIFCLLLLMYILHSSDIYYLCLFVQSKMKDCRKLIIQGCSWQCNLEFYGQKNRYHIWCKKVVQPVKVLRHNQKGPSITWSKKTSS